MTAQIAHEIKNPLGSIRFATESLKRSEANGSRKDEDETLQVIERSVDHLAAIVTELSEFARPKELNISEVDLNNLLGDLVPWPRTAQREGCLDRAVLRKRGAVRQVRRHRAEKALFESHNKLHVDRAGRRA